MSSDHVPPPTEGSGRRQKKSPKHDKAVDTIIMHPGATKADILQKAQVSEATYKKAKSTLKKSVEYKFATDVTENFLLDFSEAIKSFKADYEYLKDVRTSLEQDLRDDTKITDKGERQLDSLDKSRIRREIRETTVSMSNCWKNVVMLARQAEVVEVMKLFHKKAGTEENGPGQLE